MIDRYIYALVALVIVLAVSLGAGGYALFKIWQQRRAARSDLHPSLAQRSRLR